MDQYQLGKDVAQLQMTVARLEQTIDILLNTSGMLDKGFNSDLMDELRMERRHEAFREAREQENRRQAIIKEARKTGSFADALKKEKKRKKQELQERHPDHPERERFMEILDRGLKDIEDSAEQVLDYLRENTNTNGVKIYEKDGYEIYIAPKWREFPPRRIDPSIKIYKEY